LFAFRRLSAVAGEDQASRDFLKEARMSPRSLILLLLGSSLAAATAVSPAAAGPNVPLCFAIANNYNNCVRQHQHHGGGPPRPRYGEADDDDYGPAPGRGRGGYGYGYGYGGSPHHGGYGDRYGRGPRGNPCAAWLLQMRANQCI